VNLNPPPILLTLLSFPILTRHVVSCIFHPVKAIIHQGLSNEAGDVASGVVQIIKEFLNELPSSRKHQKRPPVDGELAKVIWAELIQKNPDTCPPSLQRTATMLAHITQVSYFGLIPPIPCCNTGQLGQPGLSWTEKKTVALMTTLASFFCSRCLRPLITAFRQYPRLYR